MNFFWKSLTTVIHRQLRCRTTAIMFAAPRGVTIVSYQKWCDAWLREMNLKTRIKHLSVNLQANIRKDWNAFLYYKTLKSASKTLRTTGCDLVKFRGTLKLRNICMGYISYDVCTILKGHSYELIVCKTSILFTNYKCIFGGKFKLYAWPFIEPKVRII